QYPATPGEDRGQGSAVGLVGLAPEWCVVAELKAPLGRRPSRTVASSPAPSSSTLTRDRTSGPSACSSALTARSRASSPAPDDDSARAPEYSRSPSAAVRRSGRAK